MRPYGRAVAFSVAPFECHDGDGEARSISGVRERGVRQQPILQEPKSSTNKPNVERVKDVGSFTLTWSTPPDDGQEKAYYLQEMLSLASGGALTVRWLTRY